MMFMSWMRWVESQGRQEYQLTTTATIIRALRSTLHLHFSSSSSAISSCPPHHGNNSASKEQGRGDRWRRRGEEGVIEVDEGVLLEEDEGVLVEEWSSRAWPATQPRRKTGSLEIGWPVVTHISWWGQWEHLCIYDDVVWEWLPLHSSHS